MDVEVQRDVHVAHVAHHWLSSRAVDNGLPVDDIGGRAGGRVFVVVVLEGGQHVAAGLLDELSRRLAHELPVFQTGRHDAGQLSPDEQKKNIGMMAAPLMLGK